MSLSEGLYSSKYILKKYSKEDALRGLSKKQLVKVIDTLDKELQFQNSNNSGSLAFFGLVLVVIFYIMPLMTNSIGGGTFTSFNGKTYKLESVDLKMIGEEFNGYPDGVTGTYKIYNGFGENMTLINIGMFFYMLICIHYFSSTLHTRKIYKVYNRASYICSLK